MDRNAEFRRLPSVDSLVADVAPDWPGVPHGVLVDEARRVLQAIREEWRACASEPGPDDIEALVRRRVSGAVSALTQPSLRRVINATGVVLHTNLGRAPLGGIEPQPGYTNLEYDVEAGRRGRRDVHAAGLLERLLAAPAIVVNNNAAAVFLALNELAAGAEVVVSRGELIEIGDGFRIPDIMARSGAVLREVGTTNRTGIEDYRAAINERTRLLLRVHPSNFRIEGFTSRPSLPETVALARERGLPLFEDLGSGCLADLRAFGVNEPLAADSLRAGADLVSFSGDKLLGGPQAGILAGRVEIVERLRRNPLFRALRVDKLIYQALETTLRRLLLENWDQIPALAMIRLSAEEIRARSGRLAARVPELKPELVEGESLIGGGSTPELKLPTCLLALKRPDAAALERRLRSQDPPVITRLKDGWLLVDLRTVFPAEEDELVRALQALSR